MYTDTYNSTLSAISTSYNEHTESVSLLYPLHLVVLTLYSVLILHTQWECTSHEGVDLSSPSGSDQQKMADSVA